MSEIRGRAKTVEMESAKGKAFMSALRNVGRLVGVSASLGNISLTAYGRILSLFFRILGWSVRRQPKLL